MAKTDPIDIFKPPDRGESPGLGASRIRTLARAFVEMLGVDHYVGSATDGKYTEDAAGEHAKVTLRETTKPPPAAQKGIVYVKNVSGATELFYEDAAGNEIQLSTGGAVRLRSGDYTFANNTQLKAMNASGSATVNMLKVNASDKPEMPDGSQLATSAAPTADAQLVNKKFVDDGLAAKMPSGGNFGSWVSKLVRTEYTAATDGIVVAYSEESEAAVTVETPKDTVRVVSTPPYITDTASVTCPVRKGDTWYVQSYYGEPKSAIVWWLPLGA